MVVYWRARFWCYKEGATAADIMMYSVQINSLLNTVVCAKRYAHRRNECYIGLNCGVFVRRWNRGGVLLTREATASDPKPALFASEQIGTTKNGEDTPDRRSWEYLGCRRLVAVACQSLAVRWQGLAPQERSGNLFHSMHCDGIGARTGDNSEASSH